MRAVSSRKVSSTQASSRRLSRRLFIEWRLVLSDRFDGLSRTLSSSGFLLGAICWDQLRSLESVHRFFSFGPF